MGDQCETFCFDWASLEPVYLNTLEMPFLELVLVCPPTVESWWMYLFPLSRKSPRSMSLVPVSRRSPRSKCFLTLRRRRRWKTCLLLLRR